jgi:hypothetical protein
MGKRRTESHQSAQTQLQQELYLTGQALKDAYEKFNYVSEPELVEACVYEISALKARYNYLLRCIKERGGQTEGAFVAAAAMKGGHACQS